MVLVFYFSVVTKETCIFFCFWFGEHEDIGWAKRVGDLLMEYEKKLDDLILKIIE